jgi:hypothetical protein
LLGLLLNGSATDYASVWNFEYDADGRLTKERLNGQVDGTETLYPLGERKVEFDKAGRRTKQAFKSESDRTGYLALDTHQTYTYDSTKKWLTQIQRGLSATEKAQYEYDESDGRLTKVTYGNGARAEYLYNNASGYREIAVEPFVQSVEPVRQVVLVPRQTRRLRN